MANGVRRFANKLRHPSTMPVSTSTHEEFWALKNVSFEIQQGDRVGIIGRNGAGKSTLLKILSRITEPTSGRISIRGRVASLLEVGTGFHPELTGRENIFLNGAILGMSRADIAKNFDEIVAFAEVEKFLDTPVKHFSSGMYVRLAFAVAAHLEPEILIVDEVLAVGDASFQKKCLGKMEAVGKGGRTVLFVSHNMAMISNLCQKGIVLKQGGVLFDGGMSEAVLAYYRDNLDGTEGAYSQSGSKFESENAVLLAVELIGPSGATEFTIYDELVICMRYRIKKDVDGKFAPNFHFYRSDGVCAFVDQAPGIDYLPPGEYIAKCKVPGNLLNDGVYFVGVALTTFMRNHYADDFYDPNALTFNIVDPLDDGRSNRYGYAGPMPGAVRPRLSWIIEKAAI